MGQIFLTMKKKKREIVPKQKQTINKKKREIVPKQKLTMNKKKREIVPKQKLLLSVNCRFCDFVLKSKKEYFLHRKESHPNVHKCRICRM